MIKTIVIFGTRPEAIKLAPVIFCLRENADLFDTKVCVTGQHSSMLYSVLDVFDIKPDFDFEIMSEGQTLFDVTTAVLRKMERLLDAEKPDLIIVQGDTTTAFAASLSAFYKKVKIAHVEAGLRTNDKYSPFPEEINRRITSLLADFHFAPTQNSKDNLLKEVVKEESISVTGNTVIDALKYAIEIINKRNIEIPQLDEAKLKNKKLILVTGHRRESFGEGFQNICSALKEIALKYKDEIEIVYPVHLNPNVQKPAYSILGNIENINLIPPLDYLPFVKLMKMSYLILTDSGGIQEEAPYLKKPVLVMRETTERPEGVIAGTCRLVGTETDKIIAETEKVLFNQAEYDKMASSVNPYGDGNAAEKIIDFLKNNFKSI